MHFAKPAILQASGVIFDVDGTIVDSVDFHAEAWQRAFAEFDIKIDLQTIRSQIGKGGDQLMPVFVNHDILETLGTKIEAFRKQLFEHDYLPRVRGFPKVRPLFAHLIASGKSVALGSSANSDDLKTYKKVAGLEGFALVETTSDDADKSKPHPDIFLAALNRLKLSASDVMVVGDSPYDAEAATAAGMRSTGLLCGGFPEAALRRAGATEIYRDPEDLLSALRAG